MSIKISVDILSDIMATLNETQRIEILCFIRCGETRTQQPVCDLFHAKYPERPINQSTVSKIENKIMLKILLYANEYLRYVISFFQWGIFDPSDYELFISKSGSFKLVKHFNVSIHLHVSIIFIYRPIPFQIDNTSHIFMIFSICLKIIKIS